MYKKKNKKVMPAYPSITKLWAALCALIPAK